MLPSECTPTLPVSLLAAGIEHVWLAGPEMAALEDALPESVYVEYREKTEELRNSCSLRSAPGATF